MHKILVPLTTMQLRETLYFYMTKVLYIQKILILKNLILL